MLGAQKKRAWTIIGLGTVGLGLSVWLTYLHVRLYVDPSYVPYCAYNPAVNCETVAVSRFSIFWGVPLSVWGLVTYMMVIFVGRGVRNNIDGPGCGAGVMTVIGVVLGLSSVVLSIISLVAIEALCPACLGTYLVNIAIALIAFKITKQKGGFRSCLTTDLGELQRPASRWISYGAAFIACIIGLKIGLPKYWEFASWRNGPVLETGFDENGRPWMGAKEPKLVVHEYFDYECPYCRIAHKKLRRRIATKKHKLRVVRYNYGRMACAPNDSIQRKSRCALVRAAYCMGTQDQFWEWNDAVMSSTKPVGGQERRGYERNMAELVGADLALFDECLYSAKAVSHAHKIYLDAVSLGIKETPAYIVNGRQIDFEELITLVRKL